MNMVSMAQVVERKTGKSKVQGSHLTPIVLKLCVSGHGSPLLYNCLSTVRDCDGEGGRALNSETQDCGFYPHIGQIFVFF
jgi:hypothetical protein